MGSTLMAPRSRSCPTQGKIRYDVRTGKPYPGQFEERNGKQVPKTNTKVKKWNPTVPCTSGTWQVAAKSKRWYGSFTLPESDVTTVKNPDLGYVEEGFNRSNLYAEDAVAVYPPFEYTATLRDPRAWCSSTQPSPDPSPSPDPPLVGRFAPDFSTEGYPNQFDREQTATLSTLTDDPSVIEVKDDEGEPGLEVGASTYLFYSTTTNISFALNESFTVSFRTILRNPGDQPYTCWWCNSRLLEGIQPGFSIARGIDEFGFLMFLEEDIFILTADLEEDLFDGEWHSFVVVYKGEEAYEPGAPIDGTALSLYIDGYSYDIFSLGGDFPNDPEASKSEAPTYIGFDPYMGVQLPEPITEGGPTISQLLVRNGAHPPTTILGRRNKTSRVGPRTTSKWFTRPST